MKLNNIIYKKDLILDKAFVHEKDKFCSIGIKNSDTKINEISSLLYCGSDDFKDETFYKNIIIPMFWDNEASFLDLGNTFMLISIVDATIDNELVDTIISEQKRNMHTYDDLRVILSAQEKISIISEIQKHIT